MTLDEEIEYYQNILERGMAVICEAMEVDSQHYDTDKADGECYLDCFNDAAKLIKDKIVRAKNTANGLEYLNRELDVVANLNLKLNSQ